MYMINNLILKIIPLFLFMTLFSCYPAIYANEQERKSCLESAEKYMNKKDAETFCKQPVDCRKWWNELSDKEKEEMQPPIWKKDPSWMTRC